MSERPLNGMVPVVERIAREAGEIAMQGYRAGTAVRKKGAIDLVTEFDVACEVHILAELRRAFPEIRVVAEESHDPSIADRPEELVFYVDPIDGTMNYAHGHPFFCASIGLSRAGAPLLGVIHAPALGVTWSGSIEGPAMRNSELCKVAERDEVIDFLCATGFPRDRASNPDNNYSEFVHIKNRVRGVRRCGSAALDLAMVADGTYDVYWEQRLSPWDVAAGAALVLAAGGKMRGFEASAASQRIDVRNGAVIAASSTAYQPFVEMFDTARAQRKG